eukprot:SAG31_NODE_4824_length_2925_cov_11.574310_1_plen_111_part_00
MPCVHRIDRAQRRRGTFGVATQLWLAVLHLLSLLTTLALRVLAYLLDPPPSPPTQPELLVATAVAATDDVRDQTRAPIFCLVAKLRARRLRWLGHTLWLGEESMLRQVLV